ncbi:cytochrome c oxidase assembly protein [Bradyrhizobium sp. ORS 111]|uniref:cytochrome c oxidase assembly protein n=1 Tax=Bradyrhizobium sp. ORS 111 TaxID=1685958 RepID=UPI003890BBE2
MRKIAFFLVTWASIDAAHAHSYAEPADSSRWTFDPWVVVPLLVVGSLYALGAIRLARRSTRRTGRAWRHLTFLMGWLSLIAALVSPMHWLGERMLAFHMVEHEILMAISAPLLVLARPVGIWMWSFPRRLRVAGGRLMRSRLAGSLWSLLSGGRNATLLHAMAIWAWHAPPLFDAAVSDPALHRLQHLSFFATAVLFWWSVLRRSAIGAAAWHVFVTMLHTSVLGALMALSPRLLYQQDYSIAGSWGLSQLEDQQLAGLIMWVPAGTIYAGVALALIAIWINGTARSVRHSNVVGVS